MSRKPKLHPRPREAEHQMSLEGNGACTFSVSSIAMDLMAASLCFLSFGVSKYIGCATGNCNRTLQQHSRKLHCICAMTRWGRAQPTCGGLTKEKRGPKQGVGVHRYVHLWPGMSQGCGIPPGKTGRFWHLRCALFRALSFTEKSLLKHELSLKPLEFSQRNRAPWRPQNNTTSSCGVHLKPPTKGAPSQ